MGGPCHIIYLKMDFAWYDGDLSVNSILNGLNETSDIGLALELDVLYPTNLHHNHYDLPHTFRKESHHRGQK